MNRSSLISWAVGGDSASQACPQRANWVSRCQYQSIALQVVLSCKIPRVDCKRHRAFSPPTTMFTDWKWHHCSSAWLHSEHSPSRRTVNTDAANEIKQGRVWLRCDSDTDRCWRWRPTWVKHAIFISWAESSPHLWWLQRLPLENGCYIYKSFSAANRIS